MRRTRVMRLAQESEAACRAINPEAPHLAAESLQEMWKTLNDALPIIEREAESREAARYGGNDPDLKQYYREMRDLADRIDALLLKARRKE